MVKRFGPFVLLGLAEILIFFNRPRHFFIADSLTWITYRYRSFGEFLAGFLQSDPAFWYRPLSQRTVVSILFPLVHLNPIPYRIVGFALFFACTLAVFKLAEELTESRRIAWFTVLVFMPHLIHAFVTYDVAFTPELLFTLFYIGSAVFYVRYLRTSDRSALIGSLVLFVASLLSKETAAALPFALLAIWLLLPGRRQTSLLSLTPHFAILAAYLLFVVGYLHIRHLDLGHLMSGNPSSVEYAFGVGWHIPKNFDTALTWAFGISRGVQGYWEFSNPVMPTLLGIFRALIGIGAVCVLFTPKRNYLILGIAWFFIAAAPTLPLIDHFLPYYLFAPLVGFALAVATVLDWAYAQCSERSSAAALAVVAVLLGTWTWIQASTANIVAVNHALLGPAAHTSLVTMRDIQAVYPKLPEGSRVVLFNEDMPDAARDQMGGLLLQLAYNNPALITDYVTEGFSIPAEDVDSDKVLAFKWNDGHFVDITPLVRQRPDLLKPHVREVNYHVELSATEVRAGMDSFILRIPEIQNASAAILYALDGKVVMEPFKVELDGRGEHRFDVRPETKPGLYTFLGVRRLNDQAWVPVSRSIRVK